MRGPKMAAFVLSLEFFGIVTSYMLNYRELQELGVSCPQQDSCATRNNRRSPPNATSCECDPLCGRRGTCCIDSPFLNPHKKPKEQCTSVYFPYDRDIFMVSQCDARHSHDNYTKSQCEGSLPLRRDPLQEVPVTSLRSQITYRNLFCAECNGERGGALVPWNLVVKAYFRAGQVEQADRDTFFDKLVHNENSYGWEYTSKDEPVGMDFGTYPPQRIRHLIKQCTFRIEQSCSAEWPDDDVKAKCEAYMAVITIEDRSGYKAPYRNVHCAICRNVTVKESTSCAALSSFIREDKPFNPNDGPIAETFDVSLSDGDRVGRVKCCRPGEVIDPFNGSRSRNNGSCAGVKCRPISCRRRGYVIRNFRCVPGSQ